ncbi:MAG TPA: DUF4126 family protein [Gemmatimonadales bacterium]|nr:DUF4126 family protein [Gemmatimonadales bacterium]
MSGILRLMLPLVLGFVAGLRSVTAPAAVSWAACYGWLNLDGTPLQFMGSWVALGIFTLAALAEYVADKLPRTPNRTTAGPLIGRIVLGGLSGAAVSVAMGGTLLSGGALGGLGAVLGTYAGYHARRRLVSSLGVRDLAVALGEDLLAILLAVLVVTRSR